MHIRPLVPCGLGETGKAAVERIASGIKIIQAKCPVQARHGNEQGAALRSGGPQSWARVLQAEQGVFEDRRFLWLTTCRDHQSAKSCWTLQTAEVGDGQT